MQHRNFIILLLLLFPVSLLAQEVDITGLWQGTIYNDTTQAYYKYEVGISKEKKGYSGFSHTWFILDDKQYYGVKNVKIKVADDGKIIIEDDGLIANNYPVPPNKNVRQLNILNLDASDSIMKLTGPFVTNRTKEFHRLTGSISLERKNDFWQSALVPHLQELGKENDLSFVRDENESTARLNTHINVSEQDMKKREALAIKEKELETRAIQKALKDQEAVNEKTAKALAKIEADAKLMADKEKQKDLIAIQSAIKIESAERDKAAKLFAKNEAAAKSLQEKQKLKDEYIKQQAVKQQEIEKGKAEKAQVRQETQARLLAEKEQAKTAVLEQQAEKQQELEKQQSAKAIAKKAAENKIPAQNKNSSVYSATPAAFVNERITILQQTVMFSSDSLQLTLYDNGEVDGDTVTVLLNGEVIIAKQGLSTLANKKTIYIPSNSDRVELIMYAESMGTIPPNTGLLVVRDGKSIYEVRFSGDMQKNASILFIRRKE